MKKTVIGLLGVVCTIGSLVGIFYPFIKMSGFLEFIKIMGLAIGKTLLLIIGIACIVFALLCNSDKGEENE